MHSFTQIAAILLAAASVLAIPAANPAPAGPNKVFETAEALGVDISGPIPDDYTAYDTITGAYQFDAGTKASAWVAAQLTAANARDRLQKRQGSGSSYLPLAVYTGAGCTAGGWYVPDVQYNEPYWTTYNSVSYWLGGGLLLPEQLDFSAKPTANSTEYCGLFRFLRENPTVSARHIPPRLIEKIELIRECVRVAIWLLQFREPLQLLQTVAPLLGSTFS